MLEERAMIGMCRICLMLAWALAAGAIAETEVRDVTGFERVLFALPGNLSVEQGGNFEVVVEAEPDDLERIETQVNGDELAIRWDQGLLGMWGGSPGGRIAVRVTMPQLEGLEVAGSGDVEAGSWLTESLNIEVNGSGSVRIAELATEELSLEVAGSGDITVPALDAAALRVEIKGSGNVELAGAADRQEIEVMGSGDVDTADLEGARVEVEVMGSGDVTVWANRALSVDIMGSGDVRYRGSPTVDSAEHGSGRVRGMR
jgi:hypothetical protein